MLFCCPKCKGALEERGGSAVCALGHSYDKSKYGYYNLLLGASGGTHGDNREMIAARSAFLSGGHYYPLAEAVRDTALFLTEGKGVPTVLDCGAGEGYYTDVIERALYERDGASAVYAFDISKDAARAVRRRNPRVRTAVFGSYSMPVPSGSVTLAVNMFSPNAKEEIHRVLKTGGVYIMVIPEREHLFELKAELYETPYKNEVEDTAMEGFELLREQRVSYKMELDGGEIGSLFAMTPYAYRTSREGRDKLCELSHLSVTADFLILAYRRL